MSGAFGTNWLDLSSTSNRYIQTYYKGFVDISGGPLYVRNNNLFVQGGDVSLNGRLFAAGDVSLNGNVFVTTQVSSDNSNKVATTAYVKTALSSVTGASAGFTGDVSINNRLYVGSDASLGSQLYVAGDVTINKRAFVTSDMTLSSKLTVSNDVSFGGNVLLGTNNIYLGSTIISSAGTAWTNRGGSGNLPSTGSWARIAVSNDGNTLIVANYSGNLYISANKGATWTVPTNGISTAQWQGVAVSSNGQIILAQGYIGSAVYLSTNGGSSWTTSLNTGGVLYGTPGVAMSGDGTKMIASPEGGPLYLSTNTGSSWTALSNNSPLPASPGWRGLAVSLNGTVMIAGTNSSGIYLSINSGSTWSNISASGTLSTYTNWVAVALSSTGSTIMASSGTALFISTNTGSTWTNYNGLNGLPANASSSSVEVSDNGQIMMVQAGTGLYISYNAGSSWTNVATAASLPTTPVCAMSGDGSLMMIGYNSGTVYTSIPTYNKGIGIGTTTPLYTLDVSGSSRITGNATVNSINTSGVISFNTTLTSPTFIPDASQSVIPAAVSGLAAPYAQSWTVSGTTWTVSSSVINGTTLGQAVVPGTGYINAYYPAAAFVTYATNTSQGTGGVRSWGYLGYHSGTLTNGYYPFNGAVSAYTTTSGVTGGIGTLYGNWIQLQSSTATSITSFAMAPERASSSASNMEGPGAFYILGTNDGTFNTWDPILYGLFPTSRVNNNNTNAYYTLFTSAAGTTGYVTEIFPIPSGTASGVVNGSLTYTTYGNAKNSYSYFRLVVTGAQGSGGAFFNLYYTFATSSASNAQILLNSASANVVDVSGKLQVTNGFNVINSDASLNGNVYVGKDLTVNGNFYVQAYTTKQLITELSYQLIIAEDISVNGRLFLSNDASINNRLFVGSDVSMGGRLFVAGDVSLNGNVFVTTQVSSDNSTKVATTAYVKSVVGGISNTYFATDVSFASRVFVAGDVSLNGSLGLTNSRFTVNNTINSVLIGASFGLVPLTFSSSSTAGYWGETNSVSFSGQYFLGADPQNGGGANRGVLISSDFGVTTRIITGQPFSTVQVFNTAMSSDGSKMALTTQGTIYYSTNYGVSWSAGYLIYPIAFLSATTNFSKLYGLGSGGVYLSTNFGATFSLISTAITNSGGTGNTLANNNKFIMNSSTGQYGVALVGTTIYYTSNSGVNWTASTGVTGAQYLMMSSTGQYVIADTGANTTTAIYYSSNYGQTFTVSTVSVAPGGRYSAGGMDATGQYCTIGGLISTNFGVNWTQSPAINAIYTGGDALIGTATSGNGLYNYFFLYGSRVVNIQKNSATNTYFPSLTLNTDLSTNSRLIINNDAFLNGNLNSSLITTLSGDVFANSRLFVAGDVSFNKRLFVTGDVSLGGALGLTGGNIYVNNVASTVLNPTLFGSTTLVQSTNAANNSNWGQALACSYTGQYIMIGNPQGIAVGLWISTNYGSTLTQVTGKPFSTVVVYSVCISADGSKMALCTGSKVYYSVDYGTNWSAATTLNAKFLSCTDDFTRLYAYGAGGVFLSTNNGSTFTSLSTTITYSGSGGGDSTGGNFSGNNFKFSMSGTTGQYGVAYHSSNIYYTSNYGATWTISTGLSGIGTGTYVEMSSSGQYAVIDNNGSSVTNTLFYSSNFGVSFTASTVNDVTSIQSRYGSAPCSSSGRYGIVANLITTDYGANWYYSNRLNSIYTGGFFIIGNVISGDELYNIFMVYGSNNLYVQQNTTMVQYSPSLLITSDISTNSRLFINNDVSMGSNLYVGLRTINNGDISANARLYVGSDASFGGKLFTVGDASLNGNVSIGSDLTVGGNLYVKAYTTKQMITELSYQLIVAQDMSVNGRLFLSNDASLNNRLFVGSDASFGTRVFIAGDLSVNGNVNINGNLTAVTQTSTDNSTKVATTAYVKTALGSLGASSYFATDVSMAARLYVISDLSLQGRLLVGRDASLNANLFVKNNVTVGGNVTLPISSISQAAISGFTLPFNVGPIFDYTTPAGTPINICINATGQRGLLLVTNSYLAVSNNLYIDNSGATGSWTSISGDTILPNTSNWRFMAANKNTGQYVLIVDSANNLYLSTNYGAVASWTKLNGVGNIPASVTWTSLAISHNTSTLIASTNTTTSYVSRDLGVTWNAVTSPFALSFIAAGINGDVLFAISNTNLYTSTNYGTTWRQVGTTTFSGQLRMEISYGNNGQYIMIPNTGGFYFSNNNGLTFTYYSGHPYYSNSVAMSANGDFLISAAYNYNNFNYLTISNDFGVTWTLLDSTYSAYSPTYQSIFNNGGIIALSENPMYLIYQGFRGGLPAFFISNRLLTTTINSSVTLKNNVAISKNLTVSGTTTITGNTTIGASVTISGNLKSNYVTSTVAQAAIKGFLYPFDLSGSPIYQPTYLSSIANNLSGLQWLSITNGNNNQYTQALANNNGFYLNNNYLNINSWTYVSADAVLPAQTNWKFMFSNKQNSNYLLVADGSNNLYISNNYGNSGSWTNISGIRGLPDAATVTWQTGHVSYNTNPGLMMVSATSGTSYISTDRGTTWTSFNIGAVYSICSANNGANIYASISGSNTIRYSTNTGTTWSTGGGYASTNAYLACNTSGSVICAADFNTNYYGIYTSTNYGITFTQTYGTVSDGYNRASSQIVMNDTGTLVVATQRSGQGTALFVSSDSGSSFTALYNEMGVPANLNWGGIAMRNDGTAFSLAQQSGTLYYVQVNQLAITTTLNSAVSFNKPVTMTKRVILPDVSMTNFSTTTDSFIGGNLNVNGNLLSKYVTYSIPQTAFKGFDYPFDLSGSPIYQPTYLSSIANNLSGLQWLSIVNGNNNQYTQALANNNGLYINSNYLNINNWTYVSADAVLPAQTNWKFMFSNKQNSNYLLVADGSNNLYISNNYGNSGSWTNISGIRGLPAAADIIWQTGHVSHNTTPGLMMVSATSGTSYISTDRGTTWTSFNIGAVYSICSANNGANIYASISGSNTIRYSTNTGTTWTTGGSFVSTNAYLACNTSGTVICAADFNTNYYGIYTSTNYGITFTQTYGTVSDGYNRASGQIVMNDAGTLVVATQRSGYGTALFVSSDSGSSFLAVYNVMGIPSNLNWGGIAMRNDGTAFSLAQQSGTLYYVQVNQLAITTTVNSAAVFGKTITVTKNSIMSDVSVNNLSISGNVISSYIKTINSNAYVQIPTPKLGNTFIICSPTGQYFLDSNGNYSTNFGSTWTILTTNTYSSGKGKISTNGQYICAYGAKFSSNYGVTWNGVLNNSDFTSLYQAQNQPGTTIMSDSGQYILVSNNRFYGTDMRTIISSDYGASWTSTNSYTAYDGDMSSTGQYVIIARIPVTIVTKNIFISVSSDYGATFTDLTSDILQYYDREGNYSNSRPLVFMSPDGQSLGVYTNGGNQVSISTNFGTSFTLLPTLPGIPKLCKITNAGYVLVATATNVYTYTMNSSTAWSVSQVLVSVGSTTNNFAASSDLTSYVYLGTTTGIFKNSSPFNTILDLSGSLTLNRADFNNYGNVTIIGNTIHAGTSAFINDVSMSSRLFCAGDVSFNRRLYVGSDVSFGGKLYVASTLTKGGGSFDIVHPDPSKSETTRLRHCFVEAPTRGDNMYRYKINAVDLSASFVLPSYYKFLNEDTQIWVNPSNCLGSGFGILENDNETVKIKVSQDGDYNVLIIGTRKDQMMIDFFDNAGGAEYKIANTNTDISSTIDASGDIDVSSNTDVSGN